MRLVYVLACLLATTSIYAQQIPSTYPGLLGLWHLNESSGTTTKNALDNSTSSLVNAVLLSSGIYGGSVQTTGSVSYVQIPRTLNLEPQPPVTIMAWSKMTSIPTDCDLRIFAKEYSTLSPFISYTLEANFQCNGHYAFGFSHGTTYTEIFSSATYEIGVWTFLAATFDGVTIKGYVNGDLEASTTITGDSTILYNTSYDVTIGGDVPRSIEYFPGMVDEVAIFNRVLSSGEIKQLFLSGVHIRQNARTDGQ